jgi:hypothetical protein
VPIGRYYQRLQVDDGPRDFPAHSLQEKDLLAATVAGLL